jgi:hypothetical protein
MEYYNKYLKYKNKYLQLKNQIGGCNPPILSEDCNLILLSEACNTTKEIFVKLTSYKKIAEDFIKCINSIKNNNILIKNNYISTLGFAQDPLIQYYNIRTNEYLNYINELSKDIPNYNQIKIPYRPSFVKKNNLDNLNEYVDVVTKYNSTLMETRDIFNKDNFISFLREKGINTEEPHIEKQLSNITLNTKEYNTIFPNTKYVNNFYGDPKTLHLEYEKGGNFISSPPTSCQPNGIILCIDGLNDKTETFINNNVCQKLVKIKCSFPYVTKDELNFRHIDELVTFMPYGENSFKIWFYGENGLTEEHKKERLENLELISQALYGSSYESNIEQFVFFDLLLSSKYKFIHPPVMNRILIETDNIIVGLFSKTQHDETVKSEWINVKSYSGLEKDKYLFFIDTSLSNNDLGNLHCLFKNTLNYTLPLPLLIE